MLTIAYGCADAVKQASKAVAAALGQGVHGKAHAARPQAAELQWRSLHCLLQQRLQPLIPCTSLASCTMSNKPCTLPLGAHLRPIISCILLSLLQLKPLIECTSHASWADCINLPPRVQQG